MDMQTLKEAVANEVSIADSLEIAALSEFQLALVGGGSGDVAFG